MIHKVDRYIHFLKDISSINGNFIRESNVLRNLTAYIERMSKRFLLNSLISKISYELIKVNYSFKEYDLISCLFFINYKRVVESIVSKEYLNNLEQDLLAYFFCLSERMNIDTINPNLFSDLIKVVAQKEKEEGNESSFPETKKILMIVLEGLTILSRGVKGPVKLDFFLSLIEILLLEESSYIISSQQRFEKIAQLLQAASLEDWEEFDCFNFIRTFIRCTLEAKVELLMSNSLDSDNNLARIARKIMDVFRTIPDFTSKEAELACVLNYFCYVGQLFKAPQFDGLLKTYIQEIIDAIIERKPSCFIQIVDHWVQGQLPVLGFVEKIIESLRSSEKIGEEKDALIRILEGMKVHIPMERLV